jgi:FixJ family two-component response regulator
VTRPLVVLVDDDADARSAYGRLLRVRGYDVREHPSAEHLLAAPDVREPACVLLDLRMPGLSGLGLQAEFARRGLEVPIVFLTGHGDVPSSVQAMKSGAVDFLEKPVSEPALLAAVEAALALSAARRAARAERAGATGRIERLSDREREVVESVVAGRRNAEIARQLGIGEQTVRVHRMHAMAKLGVSSLPELIALWRSGRG